MYTIYPYAMFSTEKLLKTLRFGSQRVILPGQRKNLQIYQVNAQQDHQHAGDDLPVKDINPSVSNPRK